MGAFVFLVAVFFLFVAQGFVERGLHFGIGAQSQGALPFGDGLVHFVHAVVGPAGEFGDVGIIGGDAAGAFEIIEGLGVLAAAQVQIGHVHEQDGLLWSVGERGAFVS